MLSQCGHLRQPHPDNKFGSMWLAKEEKGGGGNVLFLYSYSAQSTKEKLDSPSFFRLYIRLILAKCTYRR